MTENVSPETELDVSFAGVSYTVTDMAGHTVEYLKDFFISQSVPVPKDAKTSIFTMGPTESAPEAILKRENSILPRGMVAGKFQILQGWVIEVTDEYILSLGDMVVQFS